MVMNIKCSTQSKSVFLTVHVINDIKKTLKRSYKMVKGGKLFFSEKRWLKKGVMRMKTWV